MSEEQVEYYNPVEENRKEQERLRLELEEIERQQTISREEPLYFKDWPQDLKKRLGLYLFGAAFVCAFSALLTKNIFVFLITFIVFIATVLYCMYIKLLLENGRYKKRLFLVDSVETNETLNLIRYFRKYKFILKYIENGEKKTTFVTSKDKKFLSEGEIYIFLVDENDSIIAKVKRSQP